jgi:tRNA nucleotidyltransferase (CCA-adding enzyme)
MNFLNSSLSIVKILVQNQKVLIQNSCRIHKKLYSSLKFYQLESPLFKSVLTDELLLLSNIFKKNNYELRIAGGAVRDLVMNILPHDVDLATNALPDQMIDIFEKEKIRIINLNGLKHGTVPVRINDKVNLDSLLYFFKTY